MVPISPSGCDHMTVMDVELTCAMVSEGVDGTEVEGKEGRKDG